MANRAFHLHAIKLLHTLVWAFFASCIVAIPVASWQGAHRLAMGLAALVFIEVLVLFFNQWRCPLTDIAARYTEERQENFDIYLPRWLAKYNKQVFGTLYVVGTGYAWLGWSGALVT